MKSLQKALRFKRVFRTAALMVRVRVWSCVGKVNIRGKLQSWKPALIVGERLNTKQTPQCQSQAVCILNYKPPYEILQCYNNVTLLCFCSWEKMVKNITIVDWLVSYEYQLKGCRTWYLISLNNSLLFIFVSEVCCGQLQEKSLHTGCLSVYRCFLISYSLDYNQWRVPSRLVFSGLVNTFSLSFSLHLMYWCVLHCCMWWIWPQLKQQVFAGRNSDTWLRPVRLLIRDSAPPHLEERGVHIHTNTCIHVHKAAGGHYQLDHSRQSQHQLTGWM